MHPDTPTKSKRAVANISADAAATRAHVEQTEAKVADAKAHVAHSKAMIEVARETLKKTAPKVGSEKLTPEEQKRRFIEAAREVGASEDEADLDAALKRIAKTKPAD